MPKRRHTWLFWRVIVPAKRSHGADGSPTVLEGKLEPPLESAGNDSPPSLECPLNISTPSDQPFPLFERFPDGGVGHHQGQ